MPSGPMDLPKPGLDSNSMNTEVLRIERSRLDPIGQLVEVHWKSGCAIANNLKDHSLFVVRGFVEGMLLLGLVYDEGTGIHHGETTYFVNCASVDHMRTLTEHEALARIHALENRFAEAHPRD